jgi:hypothetical protein
VRTKNAVSARPFSNAMRGIAGEDFVGEGVDPVERKGHGGFLNPNFRFSIGNQCARGDASGIALYLVEW